MSEESKNKFFLKHLIAALVGALAAYVGDTEHLSWVYMVVYTVGYVAFYFGKNYAFPSTSPLGFINVWDLLSGLILAVGAGVLDLAAQWISATEIDWVVLLNVMKTAAVGYLLSKFGFGAKTVSLRRGLLKKAA